MRRKVEAGFRIILTPALGERGFEAKLKQAFVEQHDPAVVAWADKCGMTLLLGACGDNPSLASTQLLLERGANPNQANKHGNAPLHRRAQHGTPMHLRIAQLLLLRGGAPSLATTNKHGQTPLKRARDEGKTAMVKLLEERAAGPNDDGDRRTCVVLE